VGGVADKPSIKYKRATQLADGLQRDYHYTVDEKQKGILLTEEGYEVSEDILQVKQIKKTSKQH
jgi:preprotein translocase subunit SecA